MIILNRSRSYCDYCKARYGAHNLKGQIMAIFTTISKSRKATRIYTNYCQACRTELERWHDGSTWTLEQQQAYARGLDEIDYGD
jgi:hypothetical protein